MPTEMENVPVDEEFTTFVRTALTCLSGNMNNLIANQVNCETKLNDVDEE